MRALVRAAVCAALVLGLSAPARAAERLDVRLRAASAAEAGRELSRALGIEVRVFGGAGRQVSLDLTNPAPALAADRVAAALGGSWRLKLRVRPGAGPSPSAPVAIRLAARELALSLRDIPAARAFAFLASDLRADLELDGPREALERRVTLAGERAPAHVLLDRVAEQSGATWSLAIRIDASDAPPPPPPVIAPPPMVTPPPAPAPVPVPVKPVVPSATAMRATLREGLQRILRSDPGRRAEAVREFTRQAEGFLGQLVTLPPAEQQARRQALEALLPAWRRLYDGLVPAVQRELAPVSELLQRIARP